MHATACAAGQVQAMRAIDVDRVELAVGGADLVLRQQRLQHRGVLFGIVGQLAPYHQHLGEVLVASRDPAHMPFDLADPVGAVFILAQANRLEPSVLVLRQLGVFLALEAGDVGAGLVEVSDMQADQPVERFDQVDVRFASLVAAGLLDLQRVVFRITEPLSIE